MELPRLAAGLHRDGPQQALAAEADVGQAGAVVQVDLEQHVGPGPRAGAPEADAGSQGRHPEADVFQGGGEQRVLLEAVATAPAPDELGLEALQVDLDRATEEDIEVLEGNRRGVSLVDAVEDL